MRLVPEQIVVDGDALILTEGVVGLLSVTESELAVLVPQLLLEPLYCLLLLQNATLFPLKLYMYH